MINKIRSSFYGDSLQAKISKGIVWSFLGTFISKGLMLLAFIMIARIISVEEYGQVGIIRNTITTFAAFSVMSFGITATKYLAIYKKNNIIRAERILTFTRGFVVISSILIASLIFIFSDYIALKMLDDLSLSFDVKLSSATILFTALNGYQNGLLAGLERFREISFINILNGILTFPILITLAYYYKVDGIIIGLIIISFLTWIMSDYYVRQSLRKNSLKYRFDSFYKEFKIIKNFTLPSFLSGLSIAPAILITNLILAHQENGYYQLGIFNAAYFFSVITSTLNGVIGQVVYPYAMQQFEKENKRFEYFNIIIPWVIGIALNLPLILFPEIMAFFFGDKYNTADFKITIILVALFSIIIAHRQGISRNFAAANLMWWSVTGNIFWAIVLIICAIFLAEMGSIGLGISFFIAYLLNTIIFLPFYLKKKLIDKKLLISKYSLLIWIIIFMSIPIYFYIDSLVLKIFILINMIIILAYLFLLLWREFNGT